MVFAPQVSAFPEPLHIVVLALWFLKNSTASAFCVGVNKSPPDIKVWTDDKSSFGNEFLFISSRSAGLPKI